MNIIGIDLGGTWIRTGIIAKQGIIGSISSRPTLASRPPEKIIADIVDEIQKIEKGYGIEHENAPIGIGVPTVLNRNGGLFPCPNLPTMGGVLIKDILTNALHRDVTVSNDALCFTVGEWIWGCGEKCRNFLGLTLGTSIGLGLIINHKIYAGSHGKAGEIWKVPVNVLNDEVEYLHTTMNGGVFGELFQQNTGKTIDTVQVHQYAERDNLDALEVFGEFGRRFGKVLSWLVSVLDPDKIVIGGSVANSYPFFERSMKQQLSDEETEIFKSLLGTSASILGAAYLVSSNILADVDS